LAVGASRGRLVRQLLTESLLLGVLSAFASLVLAWCGIAVLSAVNPATGGSLERFNVSGLTLLGLSLIHLEWRALLFTFGAAILTALLFGLALFGDRETANQFGISGRGYHRPPSFTE